MARIQITNGTYTVDLSNYNPEITYSSEQFVELNPYFGVNQSETIDLQTFQDVITITAFITDITLFNNLMILKGINTGVTVKWNDNETTKPLLDHVTANGIVYVVIINVTLSQKPGIPANQYELTIKLGTTLS